MRYCRGVERHEVPDGVKQCQLCKDRAWRRWYDSRDEAFRDRRRKRQIAGNRANPENRMARAARQRAKRFNLPINITVADIVIPATCPILGIPLIVGTQTPTDNSPSLDRLIPALGYVRGNIAVISFRANAIKNSASADELRAVADWLNRATLL